MAKLKVVLCEDSTQTHFGAYDEVELVLKNGKVMKGTILPMNTTRYFYLNTKERVEVVYPDDIKICREV